MIFLDDMKDYIDSLNLDINVYEVNMPPQPDNCIALIEYAGLPYEQGNTATYGLELILRCRPEQYAENYEKFYAISQQLVAIGYEDGSMPEGTEINGHLYLRIYMRESGFIPLGEDDNGRVLLSKNFYVVKGEI
jgi:hypothetical protein